MTEKDLTLSIKSNKHVELNKFIVNLHAKLNNEKEKIEYD